MKALTLHQPWAWAVIHAGKDVENRYWFQPAICGQRIAIHAGMAEDLDAPEFFARIGVELPALRELTFGAIIGTVVVVDAHNSRQCVSRCSRWASGEGGFGPVVHWRLADPRPVTPVPIRGAQQLWNVPEGVLLG